MADGRQDRSASRYRALPPSAVLTLLLLVPAGVLQSAPVDRSVTIREHAGWNRDCVAIPPPPLFLIEPPSHGKVCAKAQVITIKSMQAGTESQCIGREVDGLRLIYQPDASYDGEDALVYGVQYASRLRAVAVKVDVGATAPGTASIADADLAFQSRQTPGPMPTCPQYVF